MFQHRTCLIVDDESAIRGFLKVVLADHDFQVLEAFSGVQGLRIAEKLGDALDLIITDIEMPGGDGFTMARSVLQFHPNISIVFMSGSECFGERDALGSSFEILRKPFGLAALFDAIHRAGNTNGCEARGEA